jgi:hypothetical protein
LLSVFLGAEGKKQKIGEGVPFSKVSKKEDVDFETIFFDCKANLGEVFSSVLTEKAHQDLLATYTMNEYNDFWGTFSFEISGLDSKSIVYSSFN